MTRFSQMLDGAEFGFVPGAADYAPAWNAMIAAMAYGCEAIIPASNVAGCWDFLSKPAPIPADCSVRGSGQLCTSLNRRYTPAYASEIFLELSDSDICLSNLVVQASAGTSGGIAVGGKSTAALAPGDFSRIENVYVSGAGTWLRGLCFDGSRKVTGAVGCRSLVLDDVKVFQATETGLYFIAVKNLAATKIVFVPTAGVPQYAGVYIGGGGGLTCDNTIIDGPELYKVWLDDCINARITVASLIGSPLGIRTEATCQDCEITAGGQVSMSLLGINTAVYANGTITRS